MGHSDKPSFDPSNVTIANCDREPIHVPGSIQPHGVLLAVRSDDHLITHASANADRITRTQKPLVDLHLADVVDEPALKVIREGISDCVQGPHPCHVGVMTSRTGETFDVLTHRSGDLMVLEFEPSTGIEGGPERLQDRLAAEASLLERAQSADELWAGTCAAIRRLSGLDKVMLYQFDDDWNGTVLAEEAAEGMDAYLGLRFPASDIPAQARELYRLNPIRLIPDVSYTPAVIDAAQIASRPLDLSHAVLRSVSPIHIEYLKNMGVAASMSVSLLRGDRLWGLIACHHRMPRFIPHAVRCACTLLAKLVSQILVAIEAREDAQYSADVKGIQTKLLKHIGEHENLSDALSERETELLQLVDADGVALCVGGGCRLFGSTPTADEVTKLIEWLAAGETPLFHADCLADRYPGAEHFRNKAAGAIIVTLSSVYQNYLVWFRPELVQTVRWAGDPNKPLHLADEEPHLHPRRSFAVWKEQVGRRSRPWLRAELEAAAALRESMVDALLRKAEHDASQAKDQFLAVLSHELRTPLSPVLTAASALEFDESLSPENRETMRIIRRNVELESRLIDDLLDVTRISKGKLSLHPEIVSVHALIDQTLEVCERDLHEKGLTLTLDRDATVHHTRGDPARLQQVLWNILRNAIKFTPPGGTLSIRTANLDDSRVRIEIADNGVGIAAELLPRIFNAFEQGERVVTTRYGGLGLGLAIAKTLVELNGGRISAASDGKGHGATFIIDLPAVPPPSPTGDEQQARSSRLPEQTPQHSKIRILLVEDHKDTARIMARLLEQAHYQIATADSIAAARKITATQSFDLIVSDLGLPDGSGNDLMRELRGRYDIKGIALTGWGMEDDLRATADAGFSRHLTKPVNFQALIAAIREVVPSN